MQETPEDKIVTITDPVLGIDENFDILHEILKLIIRQPSLNVNAGGICLLDSFSKELKLVAHVNFPIEMGKISNSKKPEYCLCSQVLKSGQIRILYGDTRYGCCSQKVHGYQKCLIPIKHASGSIGVLIVIFDAIYSIRELSALGGFTDMIGKSIYSQGSAEHHRLSDLILTHSKHSIMITDHELKINWINGSFTKATGYTLGEVIGRSPSVLSSGRQGKNFYTSMWLEIEKTGRWEGEVYNRRKDGIIYPEWLSIVALTKPEGGVLCYAGMYTDLTKMKAAEDEIRKMAYYDGLTGLSSRNHLVKYLSETIKRIKRNESRLAMLFIDLDGFKDVNDTLGHDVGDLLLKIIAERLKASLRDSDFIARMGGDEFCIMIESAGTDDSVEKVANNCLVSLNKPVKLGKTVLRPKASIGIAYYPDDASSQVELLKAADSAMYAAKKAGRHRYLFYNQEMTRKVEDRFALEHGLNSAIQKDQFELFYQPKVDIRSGTLEGVESLIRWHHPDLGIIPPNKFISLAEHIGIIDKLGLWVIRAACQQLIKWQILGLANLTMAVNISSIHFEKKGFSESVEKILLEEGLSPEMFEIEITESMARNVDIHIATCEALVDKGIQIAIDDFGTGYSSLSVLKKLKIHTLKIDKLFIDDLMTDPKTITMLGGILDMAEGLGFDTVVEGVETKEQVGILSGLGCRLIQGYYFSKPVQAEEIPKLAARGFSHLLNLNGLVIN